jgi:hypothetical protein
MLGTTHPMEQHILEYLNLLLSNSLAKDIALRMCTSCRFQPKFLPGITVCISNLNEMYFGITNTYAMVSHRYTVQKLVNNSIWSSHLSKTPRRKHNLLIKDNLNNLGTTEEVMKNSYT